MLRRFKSDRDEIWKHVHSSIDGVRFSIPCQDGGYDVISGEKCCHPVSEHETPMPQRSAIYSTLVLDVTILNFRNKPRIFSQ